MRAVTFDKVGDVFAIGDAAPFENGSIVCKMYANGTQAWSTPMSMMTPGQWLGIATDSESNVYIFDQYQYVAQVHANGSLGWTFTFAMHMGILVHEQGDIFVKHVDYSGKEHISKIKTNMMGVEMCDVSSASKGAGAERMLVAVTGVLLAIVLNSFHPHEMERP